MKKKLNLAKKLKLKKPLVILDIETTGPALSIDRIIEIAYIKIFPNGRRMSDDLYLDPEMEISKEASEIHGITNKAVKGNPSFREKAGDLWEILRDCYYSGFNIANFDLPILRREFVRVGIDFEYPADKIIDTKLIMQYMEPRTLSYAYKHYCHRERPSRPNLNTGQVDAEATLEILERQINKYSEINDIDFIKEIHKIRDPEKAYGTATRRLYWNDGRAYFAFSRYKDIPLNKVAKIDPKFMKWILEADFPDDLKHVVAKTLKRK